MPIRSPVIKALLGAAVGFGLLALVEGALAALDLPDPGLFEGDPATLWTLRPDLDREIGPGFHVRTNALGLRGDPPPPEGPWTLALGCSTTFGWGVDASEAWPARLAAVTGESVVNGGVPGWSTEQARRGASRWLDLSPDRVILAYIVRDAQAAPRPDSAASPTPWPWRTHLARLLRSARPPGDEGWTPAPSPDRSRVPPERYADNLRAIVAAAGDAEVVLLAFPQQQRESGRPSEPWRAALRDLGPRLIEPELPADAFIPGDGVHLSADGHARLAAFIAAALAPRPPADPPAPGAPEP